MCGRYFFGQNIDLQPFMKLLERDYEQTSLDLMKTGEIFPGDVVMVRNSEKYLLMRWGYRIFEHEIINTRLESIAEKDYYRRDYQQHKCVIPANGFYEWHEKKRYYLTTERKMIYLAGIYQSGNPYDGFSIITKPAIETAFIHHRIPAVLTRDQAALFLEDKLDIKDLFSLNTAFIIDPEDKNINI